MLFQSKFPYHFQYDRMDCGPACLRMVCNYFGRDYDVDYLRGITHISRQGVSLLDLSEAGEQLGFRAMMIQLTVDELLEDCPFPAILHWNQEHYVVLYGVEHKKKWLSGKSAADRIRFRIADPAHGIVQLDKTTFASKWERDGKGVALVLLPTDAFLAEEPAAKPTADRGKGLYHLLRYIRPYKKYFFHLLLGMLLGSLISLLFPFLMKSMIDKGVAGRSLSIVLLILLSQLCLFIGEVAIDFLRNWILLHVNTRVSLAIISDFLNRLMRLPVKFFDATTTGDIKQRINDHYRVENFLTSTALITLFSIVNILVFSIVLLTYNGKIFLLFFGLSLLGTLWIVIFLKRRKNLEYKRFQSLKNNQDSILEIISGMQEIKLNNSELTKRWEWERIQIELFKVNTRSLVLDQYQRIGFTFINQLKNIIISYIAAVEVIGGGMSVGMMLAISYIVGQTNEPLRQLIFFFRSKQDASLSLERLREVHLKETEEEEQGAAPSGWTGEPEGDIRISRLSFQYGGPHSPVVLKNINLTIPRGKITAIVGDSGSGKTTLMKLLLKFYQPAEGAITIGNAALQDIPNRIWRGQCGTVMQDGYIFADTIARNIAPGGGVIDEAQVKKAVEVANIGEFIDALPVSFATRLAAGGGGLSGGQKQRLLIARAIYKDPSYLFFDEATSSLDAGNEKVIMENLNAFFTGKTVLIIAHRLSTVRNADQIIVLQKGEIAEQGNHEQLVEKKGAYFNLVKNQLELEK